MNVKFKEAKPILEAELGLDKANLILSKSNKYLIELLDANKEGCDSKRIHTNNKIYPAISST